MMPAWRTRPLTELDLDDVLRIWETTQRPESLPGLSVADLVGTLREGNPGVVATVGQCIVGAAIAQRTADRAWIQRIAISEPWRHRGIARDLLSILEAQLLAVGVRRFSVLIAEEEPEGAAARQLFELAGYGRSAEVTYLEKTVPAATADAALLEQVGGTHLPDGLWDRIGGMDHVKSIIERRVILPLERSDLAADLGVQPPKAILLFGPPGTGKTSFARGVASRLRWPFVEIHAGDLRASTTAGADLRDIFSVIRAIDACVVFLDEVEDIAGVRTDPATRALTNDLLKVVPPFRQGRSRLLVCATNDLSSVDPAFHRPGRFDCLIPVGLPDTSARRAIWLVHLPVEAKGIDVDELAVRSKGFSPADIAHCAAAAAHRAFERALAGGAKALTTADYCDVVDQYSPSTPSRVLEAFEEQAKREQRW
jgi:ribosomal protein S18 acetylase RimI-like enzyme